MWEVRTQMSRVSPDGSDECEWSVVQVESLEEAEVWWNCRTSLLRVCRVVNTLWNPEGEVVRVSFQ